MWQEPGLKRYPEQAVQRKSPGVFVPPSLRNWKQEGAVRPFRNQFCQPAGRPKVTPKIRLSPNPILKLGGWDMSQSQDMS